jgi:hypothetical protein
VWRHTRGTGKGEEETVHEHGLFFKEFDSHLECECQLASLSNPMIYPLAIFERMKLFNPPNHQSETPLAIFIRKKPDPPNHQFVINLKLHSPFLKERNSTHRIINL